MVIDAVVKGAEAGEQKSCGTEQSLASLGNPDSRRTTGTSPVTSLCESRTSRRASVSSTFKNPASVGSGTTGQAKSLTPAVSGVGVTRSRSLRESLIARSRSLYSGNIQGSGPGSPTRSPTATTTKSTISQPVLVSGPVMEVDSMNGKYHGLPPAPAPPRRTNSTIGSSIRPQRIPGVSPKSTLYCFPDAEDSQTSVGGGSLRAAATGSSLSRMPVNLPPMDGVWLDDDDEDDDDRSAVHRVMSGGQRKGSSRTSKPSGHKASGSAISFSSLKVLASGGRRKESISNVSPAERQGKTSSIMGRFRGSSVSGDKPARITKDMISTPSNFVHASHMDSMNVSWGSVGRPLTLDTSQSSDNRSFCTSAGAPKTNSTTPPLESSNRFSSHKGVVTHKGHVSTGRFDAPVVASVTSEHHLRHNSACSALSTSGSSNSNVYSLPSTVSSEQSSPIVPPRSPLRRTPLPAQRLEDLLPVKGVAKQPSAESFSSAWGVGSVHGDDQQHWMMSNDIPPSPTTVSSSSTVSTMRPLDRKASVLLPSPLLANLDREAMSSLPNLSLHGPAYQRMAAGGPRIPTSSHPAPRLAPPIVAEQSPLPARYGPGPAPQWI
jgi:hypothetical protein